MYTRYAVSKVAILGAGLALIASALACSVPDLPGSDAPAEEVDESAVILRDDFSSDSSGWEVGEFEGGSVGYVDGSYFVRTDDVNGILWGLAFQNLGDVQLDFTATPAVIPSDWNNGFGVGCRVEEDGDGYLFLISSDGYYQIGMFVDDIFTAFEDWTSSGKIKTGEKTNNIRVICQGENLELWVNGSQLGTATDSTFTTGDIAFYAATYTNEPTEIRFDDLVISMP